MLKLEKRIASLECKLKPPTMDDLVDIVQECRQAKQVEHAERLHKYICRNGLETHEVLGNFVVPMLADLGHMQGALDIFQRLVDQNEYSWTALVQGHVRCGELQHAFDLYESMQRSFVLPNRYALQALLKACAEINGLGRGQEMHHDIIKWGFEGDPFVGSTLVDMYAKCGSLLEAQEVFNKQPAPNSGAWTALITGYTEHGHGDDALKCFDQMQLRRVCADLITFLCSLKACSSLGDVSKGQELHAAVVERGFDKEVVIGSAMVDMYSNYGLVTEAQAVFDALADRNMVSWNSLIMGYAENGYGEEALECLVNMQLQGVAPNIITFLGSVKACGSLSASDRFHEVHTDIVKHGFEDDPTVGSTLVGALAKCGLFEEACHVLHKLSYPTVFAWSTLISGYVEHGHADEALECFQRMWSEGVLPNVVTYISSLKACSISRGIEPGRVLHSMTIKMAMEGHPSIGNTLVDMYAKCGSPMEAREVFNLLLTKDVISWNALITGYTDAGLSQQALKYMEEMQQHGPCGDATTFAASLRACCSIGCIRKGRELHTKIAEVGLESDVILGSSVVDMYAKCGALGEARKVLGGLHHWDLFSLTALIAGYVDKGFDKEALDLVEKMHMERVPFDDVIYIASLRGCGNLGAILRGRMLHAEIAKDGFEGDAFVGSALVDMYAKCNFLTESEDVFEDMPVHNVVAWTALLNGYAYQAAGKHAVCSFERMEKEGLQPDGVAALGVLTACCHAGLVDEGFIFFHGLCLKYFQTLTVEHCNCIVDLLVRVDQVDEALAFFEKIPFHPTLVTWSALMVACQNWS